MHSYLLIVWTRVHPPEYLIRDIQLLLMHWCRVVCLAPEWPPSAVMSRSLQRPLMRCTSINVVARCQSMAIAAHWPEPEQRQICIIVYMFIFNRTTYFEYIYLQMHM